MIVVNPRINNYLDKGLILRILTETVFYLLLFYNKIHHKNAYVHNDVVYVTKICLI